MDKQLLRDYRERYRIVAELEQQEQQAATIAERWQQLNALWNLAVGLGINGPSDDDVATVRQRWVKLKEQYERT
jgi:hypothetical protein